MGHSRPSFGLSAQIAATSYGPNLFQGSYTIASGVTDIFELELSGDLTPTGTAAGTLVTAPWRVLPWDHTIKITTDPVYVRVADTSNTLTREGDVSAPLVSLRPDLRTGTPTWSTTASGLVFNPTASGATTVTNNSIATGQSVDAVAQSTKLSPFSGTLSDTSHVKIVDVNIASSTVEEKDETTTAVLVPVLATTATSGGVPVNLTVAPTDLTGEIKLEASSGNFAIYRDATLSSALITPPQTIAIFSSVSSLSQEASTVYLKGLTASTSTDTFTLSFTPSAQAGGSTPSGFIDTLKVRVLKVEFTEDISQLYGFDNYTNADLPWKSVENGKTDYAYESTTPSAIASQIYFRSMDTTKATVLPAYASTSPESLTFSGVAKGESEIQGNMGSAQGYTLAKMKVACYDKKIKTIAITLVHEAASGQDDSGYTSTDIDDTDISAILQKVYGQSVKDFNLTRLPAKTVDFDDNHDGKLDVDSWMSGEMTKIRNACGSSHDYNIFLVDRPSDDSSGFMSFNQKYGFIHADHGNARTIPHELGHGQGLSHTPNDVENIMYNYTSTTKWRLRKNQWDVLNP